MRIVEAPAYFVENVLLKCHGMKFLRSFDISPTVFRPSGMAGITYLVRLLISTTIIERKSSDKH
jgi:hypothetical protein